MMKQTALLALVAMTTAACGGKPPPDPAIAVCPAKTIQIIQANQLALRTVEPGQTAVEHLNGMRGVNRSATLEKNGETLPVVFYQTGLPKCPWMAGQETMTPVVVRDGVIVAMGSQMLVDMTHSGWVIKEATWPWQRYDFGYLPIK